MALRAAGMFAARMQRNRGVRRAERFAFQRAARAVNMAGRRMYGFARSNPFMSGVAAGDIGRTVMNRVTRKRKRITKGVVRRKAPRKAGKPPSTTSARVPARYAVADRMTKFRKAKVTAQKVPKSAIVHYKEFGQFNAEKCMYINHEHWGSLEKLWYGISLGLTKTLLAFGKIYNAKSLEDPCIGPRTSADNYLFQYDNKASNTILRLVYVTEGTDGATTRSYDDIPVEDQSTNPDQYLSMDAIAKSVETSLRARYTTGSKQWLQEAQIALANQNDNYSINAQPIYIQNLDDAEIHLYVNSLIKFQNVTVADHGTGSGANPYDKSAIDANPLVGRVYTAKGFTPCVDGELTQLGNKTLDTFFSDVSSGTGGITLLGYANTHNVDDLGRISSIPRPAELYGNQTVKSGVIHMGAGAMKFHRTSFSLKKTFKELASYDFVHSFGATRASIGSHTMFGLTLQHKHGEDSIQLGYNRDTDVGCYIKHKRIVHPLKTNYTLDSGIVSTTVVPTEHAE